MADKIPVIVDSRGDNTVLQALQKLAPDLQKIDIDAGVFVINSFMLLECQSRELDRLDEEA
jgi:hypothetical protein